MKKYLIFILCIFIVVFSLVGCKMAYKKMLHLDKVKTYFPIECEGIYGEEFIYSIYFDDLLVDKHFEDVRNLLDYLQDDNSLDDHYLGYVEAIVLDNRVVIIHDIGNVGEKDTLAVHDVLTGLNDIRGIKKVVINEKALFTMVI